MPIVIDRSPTRLAAHAAMTAGAQARRVDDEQIANRAVYAGEAIREGQRRQQQIDMDQRAYDDSRADLQRVRDLQTGEQDALAQ